MGFDNRQVPAADRQSAFDNPPIDTAHRTLYPERVTSLPKHALRTLPAALVVCLLAACSAAPNTPFRVREQRALATTCSTDGAAAPVPTSIDAGGRPSILVAPANYQRGQAYPLLVSLHPFSLGYDFWEAYSGLGAAASQRGYWVLIPNGSDPGPRWSIPGGLEFGVDDIAWVEELIQQTARTVCVDPTRIFAAGFSSGSAMSVGLSCELPWRFRAIASSGGSNLTSPCPSAPPVDALILHGTADPIATPLGSEVIFAPPMGLPLTVAIAAFATRNGCVGAPSVTQFTPSTKRSVYSCPGHRLEYLSMQGSGHTWAGAAFPLELFVGPTDRSFSATTEVLDFFEAS